MSEFTVRDWMKRTRKEKVTPADANTSQYYRRKMARVARSTFEWSDPEKGRLIERYLWERGSCLVWRHPILGVVITGCSATRYDINGDPIAWRPSFDWRPSGIDSPGEVDIDHAVEITDLTDRAVMRRDCLIWVDDLVDVRAVLMQQVWNQRTPLMAIASSTAEKDKIKRTAVAIGQNQSVLMMDQGVTDSLVPLDLGAPFNPEELSAVGTNIENEMLEFVGIDNTQGFEKKERLVVSEQESNEEILNAMLLDALTARRMHLDRVRELFGVELTVKVAESVRPKQEGEDADKETGTVQTD